MGTLRDPVHFIAFGFGAGLAPRAPGTFGSVVGLLAAWWLFELPLLWRVALVLAVIGFGVFICGESARRLDRHDDQRIVFDEIAGVLLTSLAVVERSLLAFALVFVFFRLFDIFKPWPIRDVDHSLRGGLGIMLDDLIAALYAAVCVATIRVLLPTI
ncbi:MAG TPA: phosphatidylglycerophosphatase A [Gammaproteobacteria bacterium]|nr:phosphatidylglycerophosphatase A [Gammaproteobacteria bacterium]